MISRKQSVAGIDLGGAAMKVIELRGGPQQWQLVHAGRVPSDGAAEEAGLPAGLSPSASQALKAHFQSERRLSRNVVTSLRGRPLMIQYLDFPKMSLREVGAAVALEAGEFVSGELDSMDMDFQVLPQPPESDKMQVMLVMAPKEATERRIEGLHRAGLNAVILDIDCLALANAYLGTGGKTKKGTVLILNIGATTANVCIFRDDALHFVRDLNFGGKNITRALAKITSLSEEEAEKLKLDPARWQREQVDMANVLAVSTEPLLEEIRLCLYYCRSRGQLVQVDRVLLTGGSASLQGLDTFLATRLEVPVEVWNPIEELSGARRADGGGTAPGVGPDMSVALGLAMR